MDVEEPTPPARVPEPFYCPLPSEVPPKEDIIVRCVTQKQSKRASATLFYRESGAEDFTPLPMTRSPRGWLSATVPAAAVTGTAFQFYLEAKLPGAKEPMTIGTADGPNLMPIVDGAAPMNNAELAALLQGRDTSTRTAPMADDQAPLAEINQQFQIEEELRKYHRRLPGAVFFSIGGGAFGATYHGRIRPDSNEINRQPQDTNVPTGLPVVITAGYSLARLFQAVGELGYQFTDRLALSVQARFQYTPADSASWNTALTKAKIPPTSALAVFLRGQYAFFTSGNFQAFASGIVGGGSRTFLGYLPRKCRLDVYNPDCLTGTGHSDTISAGPVALGVGAGIMYHLSRIVAIWVEARGMSSISPIIALGEFNGGLSFAYKFEKAAPPPPKETEGGWERPPEEGGEAPPADAPPSAE